MGKIVMGKMVEQSIRHFPLPELSASAEYHQQVADERDNSVPVRFSAQLRMEIEAELEEKYRERERQLKEQWIAEGYQSGAKDATAQLKDETILRLNERHAQLGEILGILNQSVTSVQKEQNRVVERVKADLIEVVFTAICQIIGKDFIEDKQRIERVLLPLLDEYQHEHHLEFQLSPADLALLKKEKLLMDKHSGIRFSAAPNSEAGGIMLQSSLGRLDLRLSTKLEQLIQILIKHGESY